MEEKKVKSLVCLLLFVLGGATTGCGYHAGFVLPGNISSLWVPIFQNHTLWRQIEYGLTQRVIEKLQKKGPIAIVFRPGDAQGILRGEIVNFQQTVLSEQSQDSPLENSITLAVKIQLIHRESGEVIFNKILQESWPFVVAAGEKQSLALERAFDKLAEKILYQLEPWE